MANDYSRVPNRRAAGPGNLHQGTHSSESNYNKPLDDSTFHTIYACASEMTGYLLLTIAECRIPFQIRKSHVYHDVHVTRVIMQLHQSWWLCGQSVPSWFTAEAFDTWQQTLNQQSELAQFEAARPITFSSQSHRNMLWWVRLKEIYGMLSGQALRHCIFNPVCPILER